MIIKHRIPVEKRGSYYFIDFDVPENVETITVEYGYRTKHKGFLGDLFPSNTVDIGIADEQGRFLGWSGSAHRRIRVGEYHSTNGYLTQKINPGKWKIIVGAYRVEDEGVDVTYNIDFTYKKNRLLYGDLHIHTTASDGSLSAYEVGTLARKKGLDFIALANHNNYAENYRLPAIDGLTFVPAVEWTHYKGHVNLFGLANPFDDKFIANSKEEAQALLDAARKKGALVSVNHPKCPICPYLWDNDEVFDAVEIWNGPMTKRNINAVAWWTELLKRGRTCPAVGGSDFHKPRWIVRLANPVTGVYADSPSPDDILKAIRSGRCFVCASAGSIALDLAYGDKKMGEHAVLNSDIPLAITANCKKVTLVTDKGETDIALANGRAEVPLSDVKFAYIKVLSGVRKKIVAVSNPIYFNQEVQP